MAATIRALDINRDQYKRFLGALNRLIAIPRKVPWKS
jgi:hypothetical protein